MTIDDKIGNEKLHCNTHREAAIRYTLSSDKTDKYEYLIREKLLSSNQSQIIKQPKCIFSIRKAFYSEKNSSGSQSYLNLYSKALKTSTTLEISTVIG